MTWVYRRMFPDSIWYRAGMVLIEDNDFRPTLHAHPPAAVTPPPIEEN